MKSNIFIPKTIKVGYQKREDTYTKKLAYVIYVDEKGKIRKEASWQSWRDKKIEPNDFTNEPTSGFVLNKKVGGYSSGWNHRQTYTRIYDPRGFEFEITVPNLLYILENTSSIKGKGLEGEFVYGWDGSDLILIPTDSPDYVALKEFNELKHNADTLTGKELILGATYKSKDNTELVYLGRFYEANGDNKETKSYFFYNTASPSYYSKITHYKSLTGNILDIVNEQCADNFADLMDELIKSSYYSDRDPKRDAYEYYELHEFLSGFQSSYYGDSFYTNENEKLIVSNRSSSSWYNSNYSKRYNVYDMLRGRKNEVVLNEATLETIFQKYKPKYLITYNSKGELIKKWRKTSGK